MAGAGISWCRVWAGVAAVLALVAVVGGSTLTVFQGPGCTGNTAVVSCGSCQTIPQQGGYYFSYTRGIALLYRSADCSGYIPDKVLNGDVWSCNNFTYSSAIIFCRADAAVNLLQPGHHGQPEAAAAAAAAI